MTRFTTALLMLLLPLARAELGDVHATVACDLLRDVQEDPIVSPGAVSDHLHSVYGADTFGCVVDASTAFGPGVGSSCDDSRDKSMYWTPALLFRGAPVPSSARAYLLADTRGPLSPFPLGLRVVASEAARREWKCVAPKPEGGGREEQPDYEGLPGLTTPAGTPCARWQARQEFPSCWNGRDLDSPDHAAHLAYAPSQTRACPQTHPVALPQLRLVVSYDLPDDPSARPQDLRLSDRAAADGRDTHFDFISGWDEGALADLLKQPVPSSTSRRQDRT